MSHPNPGAIWFDCLFLAAFEAAALGLHVRGLGFYSDDWSLLGSLHSFNNFSNAGRVFDFSTALAQRPVQAVYFWLLFQAFGVDPFPWHVISGLILIAMVVLLYVALRELKIQAVVALPSALLFGLSPAYSTDRYWAIALGYQLSMATFFLALYANLRALADARRRRLWKSLAVVSLLVSGLGYESAVPLFAAMVVAFGYVLTRSPSSAPPRAAQRLNRTELAVFLGPDVIALALIVAYKLLFFLETGVPADYFRYVQWIVVGSVTMQFGVYGVALPEAARWSARVVTWPVLMIGALVGTVTFSYLLVLGRHPSSFPDRRFWVRLALTGFGLFVLGY